MSDFAQLKRRSLPMEEALLHLTKVDWSQLTTKECIDECHKVKAGGRRVKKAPVDPEE